MILNRNFLGTNVDFPLLQEQPRRDKVRVRQWPSVASDSVRTVLRGMVTGHPRLLGLTKSNGIGYICICLSLSPDNHYRWVT